MIRHYFYCLVAFIFTAFPAVYSPTGFAKSINLYAEPLDNANVISTIDLSKGVVPIYTLKESGWVKVGDPNNGNVGWIKSSDMEVAPATFTQQVVTPANGQPQSIQTFKYGNAPSNAPLANPQPQQQVQDLMNKLKNDPTIHPQAQQIMQKMVNDINNFYQQQLQQQQQYMNQKKPASIPQSTTSNK